MNNPACTDRIAQQLSFVREIDKMKTELRKNIIIDQSRRENDAEHSWHIAVMAMLFREYTEEPDKIDLPQVIKMLLVHDIVEIYAGDTFCYDEAANKTKAAREQASADKIFALLPADQALELRKLWEEFEALETPEAYYAKSMDVLQPVFLHYSTCGKIWREEGITLAQVRKRIAPLERGIPKMWTFMQHLLQDAVAKGYLNP